VLYESNNTSQGYLKDLVMADHKQAAKRHKQSLKRNERNRFFISTMRSKIKQARLALDGTDKNVAIDMVNKAGSYIHKVASKGMIHKNKASRLVSRMTKHFNRVFNS
jgi:small subunit ribosomal protein S20